MGWRGIFRESRDLKSDAPLLLDWGVLRWRGAVRRLLQIRDNKECHVVGLETGQVLIDYNKNKIKNAKAVWGDVAFLNPYWLKPSLQERTLILLSFFCLSPTSKCFRAIGVALTTQKRLEVGVVRLVWNPYSLFHHAVVKFCHVSSTYLLSPKYPLPKGVTTFIGHRVIGDIYQLDDKIFTALKFQGKISSDVQRVAIYLTKLIETDPREERLLEFAQYLLARGINVAIYLHYTDRTRESFSELSPLLADRVRRENSVEDLSAQQISLSGVSTIGLELLSGDVAHFVCFGAAGDSSTIPFSSDDTPFRLWVMRQARGLDRTASDFEWVRQICEVEPDRAKWLMDLLGSSA